MPKHGKLILIGGFEKLLFFPKTEAERKKALANFGWSNEDYRQAVVGSVADAVAQPEDFMPFYFRHLSATIVGAYSWKATEFTEASLKAAAAKLQYKPAYVNHELEVGNIIGANGEIKFVGSKKAQDGTIIPGGLEGPIWIDAKLHTDLCRKLTAYPVPHIQSVSVTVSYNWEPSHEFTNRDGQMDEWEFEMNIGKMVDGTMVRRIVTEIIDFTETSLVYLGADPYAKILDSKGNPINIEKASIVGTKQFDKDPMNELYKSSGMFFVEEDSLGKEKVLHLIKSVRENFSKTGNFEPPKTNKKDMEKIVEALAKKLGKDVADMTPEIVNQYSFVTTTELEDYKKAKTDLGLAKDAKTKVDQELVTANATIEKYSEICKVEELEEVSKEVALKDVRNSAKFGASILKAKREECVRLYKLKVGEKDAVEAVVDTINKADEAALSGLLKQYGGELIETFGGSCKSCGSKEIQFRSSQAEGGEKGEPEVQESRMAERHRY